MKKLIIVSLVALFLAPFVFAETVKEIITEAKYLMCEGETAAYAEEAVLHKAKQRAAEEAGTFIQSQTVIQNYQVVKDEIMTIAGGILQVKVLDEKRYTEGEDTIFYIKIQALVDTSNLQDLMEVIKNKQIVEEYRQLQEDFKKLQEQNEELKKALAQLPKNDKKRKDILKNIKKTEEAYKARRIYEDVTTSAFKKVDESEKEKVVETQEKELKEAMKLDPNFMNPIFRLGQISEWRGDNKNAKNFFDKAKKINPGRASVLFGFGASTPPPFYRGFTGQPQGQRTLKDSIIPEQYAASMMIDLKEVREHLVKYQGRTVRVMAKWEKSEGTFKEKGPPPNMKEISFVKIIVSSPSSKKYTMTLKIPQDLHKKQVTFFESLNQKEVELVIRIDYLEQKGASAIPEILYAAPK